MNQRRIVNKVGLKTKGSSSFSKCDNITICKMVTELYPLLYTVICILIGEKLYASFTQLGNVIQKYKLAKIRKLQVVFFVNIEIKILHRIV